MANQLSARVLLACGAAAGPIYVTVTMAEALTRDGFDLRQHRFSWLTAGDLGWIHQGNMVLVGVLTVLLAVGVRQTLRTGRGAVWGPRLLGLFGVAYIIGGILRADPVAGFPPGTTPEMVHTTWQGAVQNASRGASSLLLIATSLVIAGWFAAEGHRAWAWFYGAAIPTVFVALTAVGLAIGGNPTALAFLMTPWTWMTALAVHLYRRQAKQHDDVPAGQGLRSTPLAFAFCPDCGGRLRLVATIEERAVVEKILLHLGLPVDLPSPASARSPEWLFGQAAGTGRQWPD